MAIRGRYKRGRERLFPLTASVASADPPSSFASLCVPSRVVYKRMLYALIEQAAVLRSLLDLAVLLLTIV